MTSEARYRLILWSICIVAGLFLFGRVFDVAADNLFFLMFLSVAALWLLAWHKDNQKINVPLLKAFNERKMDDRVVSPISLSELGDRKLPPDEARAWLDNLLVAQQKADRINKTETGQ